MDREHLWTKKTMVNKQKGARQEALHNTWQEAGSRKDATIKKCELQKCWYGCKDLSLYHKYMFIEL
jgi:hypothetical protein